MSDLQPRTFYKTRPVTLEDASPVLRDYVRGALMTKEEAAYAMIAFFDHYSDDVGWPMLNDALQWLDRAEI